MKFLNSMVHMPMFYKRIHKKHHEWTAPIGLVWIYSHPFEHLVSNLIPVATGPLLLGSHCITFWIWILLAITATTIVHSGYHLPFLPSAEFHDYHHLKTINNFGVVGILDRLHGTDSIFLKSKEFKRHFIYFSLTPPKIMDE